VIASATVMPARLVPLAALVLGACTAVDHRSLGDSPPEDAGEKICCSRHAAAFDASVERCDEELCERVFLPPNHHNGDPSGR
jgi:hypothetical protein